MREMVLVSVTWSSERVGGKCVIKSACTYACNWPNLHITYILHRIKAEGVYVEYSEVFKHLLIKSKNLPLPNSCKQEIQEELGYFLTLAESQRDLTSKRQQTIDRWRRFSVKYGLLGLFEQLDHDQKLSVMLARFISKDFASAVAAETIPVQLKSQEDAPKDFDPERFFMDLRSQANKIEERSEQDKIILRLGLNYLSAEARIPRAKRDTEEIQRTWNLLRKVIVRYRLTEKFKGDTDLRSKIRFFIFGRF